MRDISGIGVVPSMPVAGTASIVTVYGTTACGAVTVDYGDGIAITYAINGLPVSNYHTWSTGGSKTITATGQSMNCQDQRSASVTVNAPPAVSIAAPGDGTSYFSPATVTVTASASDSDGSIAQVQLYENGTLLTTLSAAPYTYTWTGVATGSYALYAIATDNLGAQTTSAPIGITVGDPPPNTVLGISVVGPIVAGQATTVTVSGTNPCGAVQIDFGDGNAPYIPIYGLPYSTSYTWWYPGTYTLYATGEGNCVGQVSTTITVTAESPEEMGTAIVTANQASALSTGSVAVSDLESDELVHGPAVVDEPMTVSLPEPITNRTLIVDIAGSGSGTVISSPAGLTCSGQVVSCTGSFSDGTSVTLIAAPDPTMTFVGWGGGACQGTGNCTVQLNATNLVIATFRAAPPQVVHYYHADVLGSIRVESDNAGAVVARHDYLPFGEEFGGTPDNQMRFAGKERDSETGFDYFGARYYGMHVGRFASVDPLLDSAKAELQPQRWNRYAYVMNNPAGHADVDGRQDRLDAQMNQDVRDLMSGKMTRDEYEARLRARGVGAAIGLVAVGAGLAGEYAVYGLVRIAPLMTATGRVLTGLRSDLEESLSSLSELSTVTQARVGKFLNALADHLSDSDISGIVKNAAGLGTRGDDHLNELQDTVNSAANLAKSLAGRLALPGLSADQRLATLEALNKLNLFINQANSVISSAK